MGFMPAAVDCFPVAAQIFQKKVTRAKNKHSFCACSIDQAFRSILRNGCKSYANVCIHLMLNGLIIMHSTYIVLLINPSNKRYRLMRKFSIRYFVEPHQVEIVDSKTNRLFLKKTACPETVSSKDFFVGSKILMYGRNYELMAYLDQYTRDQLGQCRQKSVAIVLPDGIVNAGKIVDAFSRSQLTISALKMIQLTATTAAELYDKERGQTYFSNLIEPLCQAPIIAVEVVGDGSIEKLKQIVGPLRARYGGGNQQQLQTVLLVAENALEAQHFHRTLFDKNGGNIECTAVPLLAD